MINEQGIRKLLNLDVESSSPTIIIFSEQVTRRLNYVCRFVFEHVLKIKYVVTSGREEFEASRFYKINYSHQLINGAFNVIPAGLLFQSAIAKERPPVFKSDSQFYFYSTKEGDLKFDVFSAVFYMISRYEEWQGFEADKHGRFEASESILVKHKVHMRPVVDGWIMELRKALSFFYPGIILPPLKIKTIATIDVDNLCAYTNKGVARTAGAFAKDILKGDIKNILNRIKVLSGKEKDPFDIYEEFTGYCRQINVPVFYFFLYHTGTRFDRTVDPGSPAFARATNAVLSNGGYVGIHPSYYSSENESRMQSEIKNFSQLLQSPVKLSRQHYLKFNIVSTPKMLMENGIEVDFTMGFATLAGFRAGTSHPFYYYDFNEEKERGLLFVPFCAMDGVYTVYDKKTAEEALQSLGEIKKEVEKVNGLFITVFHERTFAAHLFPGYSKMYEALLK